MNPIDAYRDTMARAKGLLLLHDGLVNTRSRRIRSDWKLKFCQLMHWRGDSEIERVDSREAVIILRDGCSLTPDDFSSESVDDLLRSSLVFGVSALDRYVHERVVKRIVQALKNSNLNRDQRALSIPVATAIRALSL